MKLQTPKGFRDFLPQDALKRQFVMGKIIQTFVKFGYDPLETPTLEYAETLKGKYGEEEKLIYEFETKGGDQVALKYDQTVPLARVIAQYGPKGEQVLTLPFKRYQIQPAFRGENTQKGRYREFLQCDGDIIGSSSLLADAELLALLFEIYQNLGLDIILSVNDRKLLEGIEPKYLSALDKLDKVGPDEVKNELQAKGLSPQQTDQLFNKVVNSGESDDLKVIREYFVSMGYPSENLVFNPTIIRGLDYYTGMIVEVRLKDNPSSLAGGGRWDKMIGKFIGEDIPAVGFAIGFDRTIEAMTEAGILNVPSTNSQVLVTIFSPELINNSVKLANSLREKNISAELWLDPASKLDKQLKYADSKGIPYVIIVGPDEVTNNQVKLKDFVNNTQVTLSLDEAIAKLSS